METNHTEGRQQPFFTRWSDVCTAKVKGKLKGHELLSTQAQAQASELQTTLIVSVRSTIYIASMDGDWSECIEGMNEVGELPGASVLVMLGFDCCFQKDLESQDQMLRSIFDVSFD